MSKKPRKTRAQRPSDKHAYMYACFVSYASMVCPRRRIAREVAHVLVENHALACDKRKRPFFTISNIADRRGRQHRNAIRAVLWEIACQPDSPLVFLPYDRFAGNWGFELNYGDWMKRVRPMSGVATRSRRGAAWEESRRQWHRDRLMRKTREERQRMAEERREKFERLQQMRTLLNLKGGYEALPEDPQQTGGDDEIAMLNKIINHHRRRLGILAS